MSSVEDIAKITKMAKEASYKLTVLDTQTKDSGLKAIAEVLKSRKEEIFNANTEDLKVAEKLVEQGKMTKSMYNRLKLDERKFKAMVAGVLDLIKLEDPTNRVLLETELDEGLNLYKISTPIGVIGVIFEARPDVIVQITALGVKSGNAVILKGGKEAQKTNQILFKAIETGLNSVNFPKHSINQIFTHEEVNELLRAEKNVDLIIPRGGNSLVKFIKENTKIPVLGHADGICHIYVDGSADLEMATGVIIDGKTQYPSACNAVETVLIDESIANEYLPKLVRELNIVGVRVKGCEKSVEILPEVERADASDWEREYGDLILSVRVVDGIEGAITHINTFGSHHTDSIIAENIEAQERFVMEVDSAGVYVNASTRFADGYRYGFGAEVGISTNKTHARGPVGLEGLTIYKYKLVGRGQVVSDYAEGRRTFTHRRIK